MVAYSDTEENDHDYYLQLGLKTKMLYKKIQKGIEIKTIYLL